MYFQRWAAGSKIFIGATKSRATNVALLFVFGEILFQETESGFS